MKGLEKFECPIPRGAEVVAKEPGIADVYGAAIGIKWSAVSGWWVEVRSQDGANIIVRSYPAQQVEVLPEMDGSGYARSGEGDWS